jgi:hypothetical protein
MMPGVAGRDNSDNSTVRAITEHSPCAVSR